MEVLLGIEGIQDRLNCGKFPWWHISHQAAWLWEVRDGHQHWQCFSIHQEKLSFWKRDTVPSDRVIPSEQHSDQITLTYVQNYLQPEQDHG